MPTVTKNISNGALLDAIAELYQLDAADKKRMVASFQEAFATIEKDFKENGIDKTIVRDRGAQELQSTFDILFNDLKEKHRINVLEIQNRKHGDVDPSFVRYFDDLFNDLKIDLDDFAKLYIDLYKKDANEMIGNPNSEFLENIKEKDEIIRKYKDEIKNLNKKINEIYQKMEKFHLEFSSINKQKKPDRKSESKGESEKILALRAGDLRREIEELRSLDRTNKNKIAGLQRDVSRLQAEVGAKRATFEGLKKENDLLVDGVKELHRYIFQLLGQLRRGELTQEQVLKQAEARIKQEEDKLRKSKKHPVAEHPFADSKHKGEAYQNTTQAAEVDKEQKKMRKIIENLRKDLEKIKGENAKLSGDNKSLADNEQVKDNVSLALSAAAGALEARASASEVALDVALRDAERLNAAKEKEIGIKQALQRELEAEARARSDMAKELEANRAELNALRGQLVSEGKQKGEALSEALTRIRESEANVAAARLEAERAVERAKEDMRRELVSLQEQHRKKESDLKSEADQARQNVEEARQGVGQERERVRELERENQLIQERSREAKAREEANKRRLFEQNKKAYGGAERRLAALHKEGAADLKHIQENKRALEERLKDMIEKGVVDGTFERKANRLKRSIERLGELEIILNKSLENLVDQFSEIDPEMNNADVLLNQFEKNMDQHENMRQYSDRIRDGLLEGEADKSSIDQLRKQNLALAQSNEKFEALLSDNKGKFEEERKRQADELEERKRNYESLEREHRALAMEAGSMLREANELREKLKQQNLDLQNERSTKDNIARALADKEKEVSDQEKELKERQSAASELEKQLNGLRQNIKALDSDRKSLEAEREALRRQIQDKELTEQELGEVRNRLSAVELSRNQLDMEKKDKMAELDRAGIELKELNGKLGDAKKELDGIRREKLGLEKEIKRIGDDLKFKENELSKNRDRVKELESEKKQLEDRHRLAESGREQALEEARHLRLEREQLAKQLTFLRKKIKSEDKHKVKNKALERELVRLKAKAKRLTATRNEERRKRVADRIKLVGRFRRLERARRLRKQFPGRQRFLNKTTREDNKSDKDRTPIVPGTPKPSSGSVTPTFSIPQTPSLNPTMRVSSESGVGVYPYFNSRIQRDLGDEEWGRFVKWSKDHIDSLSRISDSAAATPDMQAALNESSFSAVVFKGWKVVIPEVEAAEARGELLDYSKTTYFELQKTDRLRTETLAVVKRSQIGLGELKIDIISPKPNPEIDALFVMFEEAQKAAKMFGKDTIELSHYEKIPEKALLIEHMAGMVGLKVDYPKGSKTKEAIREFHASKGAHYSVSTEFASELALFKGRLDISSRPRPS